MLKFTKLLENASKIIYNVMNGVLGTVEYDKDKGVSRFFDSNKKEYKSKDMERAFYYVKKNNFPDEYLYMTH